MSATAEWSVYVLRCAGGTLYTGITNNLGERLKAHRAGRGAKYTRGRLPVELVYQERAASRGNATRREREIKRLGRSGKLALIAQAASPPLPPALRILLLGHSLIEYGDWARLLPGHAVENLGRAGETTAGLLGRLDDEIRLHPAADAVAVMSGTNDILAGGDDFLHEYRRVARRLRGAYPRANIVLHALLPLSPEWVSPETVIGANARIAAIAAEAGVAFLDLTDRFADRDGRPRARLYDGDGVHLSGEGYRVWAGALAAALGVPLP